MAGVEGAFGVCINEALTDNELQAVLAKLQSHKDKEVFGLVCKRWLHLQSTERKKLCAKAGPLMLRKMAVRQRRPNEVVISEPVVDDRNNVFPRTVAVVDRLLLAGLRPLPHSAFVSFSGSAAALPSCDAFIVVPGLRLPSSLLFHRMRLH
uniref:COI1 F-box domain-containing protein n=1 Tax=Vitis vinifera TaxID=29760 RepID=A5BPQ4_VITVI|nr:hypothetical protein VITISV_009006 [Vitis vinifera]